MTPIADDATGEPSAAAPPPDGTLASFRADLVEAADRIRRVPLVAGITGLLAGVEGLLVALPADDPTTVAVAAVLVPFAVFAVGWSGTERLVYLRLWQGEQPTMSALLSATWSLLWRVAKVGFLVLVPIALVSAGIVQLAGSALSVAPSVGAISVLVSAVSGVVLTFVLPAVVYTTPRARTAIATGLRLLRDTWPRCAWHVLVPAAAFVADSATARPVLAPATQVLFAIGWAILALWFKGAIAAFYLRRLGAEDHHVAPFDPRTDPATAQGPGAC